jgi:hypothetical protein
METIFDFLDQFYDRCPKCHHKLLIYASEHNKVLDNPKIDVLFDRHKNTIIIKYKKSNYSFEEVVVNIDIKSRKIINVSDDKDLTFKKINSINISMFCCDCNLDSKSLPGFQIVYDLNFNGIEDINCYLVSYSFCMVNKDITYLIDGDHKHNLSRVQKKKPNDGISFNVQAGYLNFDMWNFNDFEQIYRKFDTIFLLI